jgi:hypothetical protein
VHRVRLDDNGKLMLPPALVRRYGLQAGEELLVEDTEAGVTFHPLRADVRKVYLEVTTRCNLHCRTCVRNAWEEPLEDMPPATFDRVVAQLEDLPQLREVVFGGYGEPFAHPHILDYLAAVKDLGLKVTVSTNGVLLDEEWAKALVQLGVEVVSVSLDGADPSTYDDVRQGADLRAVLGNVETWPCGGTWRTWRTCQTWPDNWGPTGSWSPTSCRTRQKWRPRRCTRGTRRRLCLSPSAGRSAAAPGCSGAPWNCRG